MPVSFRHRLRSCVALVAALLLGGCGLIPSDDTRAPLVELLAPVVTTTSTTANLQPVDVGGALLVRVQVTPRGANNGVSSVRFLVDNRQAGTAAVVGTPVQDRLGQYVYTYAGTLDLTTFTDGDHRFEVIAFDRFGARGTSVPLRLRVDNGLVGSGPAARLTEPVDGASVKGAVRVVVTPEAGEIVDRVDFLVDGLTLATDSVAPFEWLWPSGRSGLGPHTLQGRAYDGTAAALTNSVRVTVTDTTGSGGGGGPVDPPPTGSFDPNCTVAGCVRFRATTAAALSAPIAIDDADNVVAVTTGARAISWTRTGAIRWTVSLPATSVSTPVLGADGTAYVATVTGRVLSISSTGTVNWTYDAGEDVSSGLALGDLGRLYFGGQSGRLHAVGVVSGTAMSGFPVAVSSSPIITPVALLDDESIVVTSSDGRVYAFRNDGTRAWVSAETFGRLAHGPSIGRVGTGPSAAPAVYVVNAGGRAAILNSRDGTVVQDVILDAVPAAAPIVGEGGGFVVVSTASVTAYSAPTGPISVRWRHPLGTTAGLPVSAGAPAFDGDGRVYVPTTNELRILTTSGDVSARHTTAPGTLAVALTRKGTVYTAFGTGIVGLFTGVVKAPLGAWPMAGASPRRTARVGAN